MKITSQITSIHSKQAAKITAIMAFVAVLAATWPLAAAAWAFSVHLPRRHFMILLFVPFFYALAAYFLVGLGCALYNFAKAGKSSQTLQYSDGQAINIRFLD